jgi:hypothetical protein
MELSVLYLRLVLKARCSSPYDCPPLFNDYCALGANLF